MSDANERDATLAQRIRDALRGVTDAPWQYYPATDMIFAGGTPLASIECATDRDGPFIAAAPSLLRDALARIEALEAEVVRLRDEIARRETILAVSEAGLAANRHWDCATGRGHTWVMGDASHVFCVYCNARKENFPDDAAR